MDGVTVGRPCCKVHDCEGYLPTQKAHYCTEHAALEQQCVVDDCQELADSQFRTCSQPSHRKLEDMDGRSALFQLRRRLERLKTNQVPEPDVDGNRTEELLVVDQDGQIDQDSQARVSTSLLY